MRFAHVFGVVLLVLREAACSEFRSYHPHYLHSYSYPQPSTVHLYYGKVVGNKPDFLIKDASESDAENIYLVNAKHRIRHNRGVMNLKREVSLQTLSRSMLVFSIEDSFEGPRMEHGRLHIVRASWGYLIALANGTDSKLYEMHVTKNSKLISHSESEINHVQISWRNVSDNPKGNWRLSRKLQWASDHNAQLDSFLGAGQSLAAEPLSGNSKIGLSQPSPIRAFRNYTAVAMQVAVPLDQLATLGIHINELPLTASPTVQELYGRSSEIEKQILEGLKQTEEQAEQPATCETRAVELLFRGLSYEYGRIKVVHDDTILPNEPKELLSFSPSRKRFPWGFLWDDGFHNEVAARVEPDTSLRIIKSWLDTMIDGWIPREQDRGIERVELCDCERFLAKDDRDGNPPSLVLPLAYLLRTGYLTLQNLGENYWRKLKEWHRWFMRTQMIGTETYLFKWFDHIQSEGSFNSGMDDFPRPGNSLYHVDAQAWMYQLTEFMVQASAAFELNAVPTYEYQMNRIKDNLDVFLDPSRGIYSDVLLNSDGSKGWSPHVGYGAILPLSFGMINASTPQFAATLKLLTDETMLNTKHGLSSIARSSPEYLRTEYKYWAGPIWINMNYAALRGLKLFYPVEGLLVYQDLRNQLVATVCGEWQRTGYFFENYKEGVGSFSYPFNGWTSLIAIVINEKY